MYRIIKKYTKKKGLGILYNHDDHHFVSLEITLLCSLVCVCNSLYTFVDFEI